MKSDFFFSFFFEGGGGGAQLNNTLHYSFKSDIYALSLLRLKPAFFCSSSLPEKSGHLQNADGEWDGKSTSQKESEYKHKKVNKTKLKKRNALPLKASHDVKRAPVIRGTKCSVPGSPWHPQQHHTSQDYSAKKVIKMPRQWLQMPQGF